MLDDDKTDGVRYRKRSSKFLSFGRSETSSIDSTAGIGSYIRDSRPGDFTFKVLVGDLVGIPLP